MRKSSRMLLWMAPMMLHSLDAQAWGLVTHVYFAQWLVWALPFADPELRSAVTRFPRLVMAGACLPDLALLSNTFRGTHRWQQMHELVEEAQDAPSRAIAIGYASHLLADVIAHNHFVPAHEAMWIKQTLFTHVTSEWAVDAHLSDLSAHAPHCLLTDHAPELATFLSTHFGCTNVAARQALRRLASADRLLRGARLPHMLYGLFKQLDRRVYRHFLYYISQTQHMLAEIEAVLVGDIPLWEADPHHDMDTLARLRTHSLRQLKVRHPQPILLNRPASGIGYSNRKDSSPMVKPMAAPANTSLG